MWRRFRPPLAVVAVALLGLIVLLAVLQYRWLGQISEAERAQRRATLAAGALEFAQDFDREVTRAYLLFQTDAPIARPATTRRSKPVRGSLRSVAGDRALSAPLKEFYAFSQDEPDSRRAPPVRSGDAPARGRRVARGA